MKTALELSLSLLFLFSLGCNDIDKDSTEGSAVRIEGVVNGGGGKGVQCGNVVRLLDLYEGELKGYPTPLSTGNFDDDIENYFYKISRQRALPDKDVMAPEFVESVLSDKKKILDSIFDIPEGQKLDFTEDATLPSIPANCRFVQIAVNFDYLPDGKGQYQPGVRRDKTLWDMMPEIDQIALLVHEYVYWESRHWRPLNNSDDSRELVSRMFSGLDTYELFAPIRLLKPLTYCTTGNYWKETTAWINEEVRNGIPGLGLYFLRVNGGEMISRTDAFIPGLNIETFLGDAASDIATNVTNVMLNREWSLRLTKTEDTSIGRKFEIQVIQNGEQPEKNEWFYCWKQNEK